MILMAFSCKNSKKEQREQEINPMANIEESSDTPTAEANKAKDEETIYETEIALADLESGFEGEFGDSGLKLDKRVLYVDGVSEDAQLPESVQSIEDTPAEVTLPTACGKIKKVN